MNTKKILFLQRQPSGPQALEAMDAILVAGVFEQSVTVLFRDEGVRQLVQQSESAESEYDNSVASLIDYGIERIYVCETSLRERGLEPEDLIIAVKIISPQVQRELIQQQDAVLTD